LKSTTSTPVPHAPKQKRDRKGPAGHPDKPKVFCIGFHKTGTTSLKAALKLLGYRITGPNGHGNPDIAANVEAIARRLVPRYDAFQDNPWPIIYQFLDREYPGSKFILTVRPPEKWIASIVDHFGRKTTKMREWIYGSGRGDPIGNEKLYVERYERHNREVLAYFAERPQDLLVLELTTGDGWTRLCTFLRHAVPDAPFPWRNSKQSREDRAERLAARRKRRKARRLLKEQSKAHEASRKR
jgi:hypothetical protein